jgi:carbamoyl-phosphate synthase large subunit
LLNLEGRVRAFSLDNVPARLLRDAKLAGFSDVQLTTLLGGTESDVRRVREQHGVQPTYHRVDTCAAEFPAYTPYLYSSYETESESEPTDRPKVIILGSGPNRIGQGLEFDYCCCHAVFGLRELGYETIMINCNPETVSTDYDTADRLYFEPLTLEDVLNIVHEEAKGTADGALPPVIVQFGGQTPLRLVHGLAAAGVPILGTSPAAIDLAEDREQFGALIEPLGIPQPEHGVATSVEEAMVVAERIGFPLVVRPSYVLGGRGMAIVYDTDELVRYMREAVDVSPDHPVLIDRFLEDAYEFDVDAVCDGKDVVIAGIMHQIELAGVHSGDSASVLPATMIAPEHLDTMRRYTRELAMALKVVGLMNIQFAMKDGVVYVLEVNPRASRTVPFVAKATGKPWAKIGAQVMAGKTLSELGVFEEPRIVGFHVKDVVLPWRKFPNVDTRLGPEMRSTGEAMGSGWTFGEAFAKALLGCNHALPLTGSVFISVNDHDKRAAVDVARGFSELGFRLLATAGTAAVLQQHGIQATTIFKVNEGRPNAVDYIKNGEIDLIVNTPLGKASFFDERAMRRAAVQHGVVTITTLSGAAAAREAISALRSGEWTVRSLQEWHSGE